jgi:hypothetical protein
MLSLVLLLIFVIVAAALWFQGLWSNAVTLVNMLLAMMIAFNYYEPVASLLVQAESSYRYLYDFLALWGLFALSFGLLRLVTDVLSRTRVAFELWVEIAGRTVLSLWIAWLFIGFTAASLHTAPLGPHPMGFQQTPMSGNFFGMAPGRHWLAFMQSRSRGALKRGEAFEFDPDSRFILKYYQRRVDFEAEPAYRVR